MIRKTYPSVIEIKKIYVCLQEVADRFCEEFFLGFGPILHLYSVTCCPVLADDAPSIALIMRMLHLKKITDIINSMNKNKSTGSDHIPVHDLFCQTLWKFPMLSLSTKVYQGVLTQIFALLQFSVLENILVGFIENKFSHHLIKFEYNPIKSIRFSGKSPQVTFCKILTIMSTLNWTKKYFVFAIFMDFKKEFKTLSFEKILDELGKIGFRFQHEITQVVRKLFW